MRMLLEGDNNLMNKEEDSEVVAAVLVASWKRGEIMHQQNQKLNTLKYIEI